jgi:hypothetical protein
LLVSLSQAISRLSEKIDPNMSLCELFGIGFCPITRQRAERPLCHAFSKVAANPA